MKIKVPVPVYAADVISKFTREGYEIYIVGGVVRDFFLGRILYDWDMTTNATPEKIQELFPHSFYDNKFGTVGIPEEGKTDKETEIQSRPVEVTTFRTEHGYSDARHPDEVRWGSSLEEDLARRDFTINAMALKSAQMHTASGSLFELVDIHGGMEDLKAKLIRTVGDPEERFAEDALRMMRAVRIGAQLMFNIEEETFEAIKRNANKLKGIAWERIREELLKTLAAEYPAEGYMLLRNTGLGSLVLPEMEETFGVDQKSPGRHHQFDVGTHSVESLRHCPSSDPVTRLATLIHDTGKVKTMRKYPDGRITFYN